MRENEDALKDYEMVLDVDARQARSPLFHPIEAKLRSELDISDFSGRSNGALSMVGGKIPGQRIYFSPKRLHCKIIDRMTLKENEALDEKIRDIARTDKFRHIAFGRYEKDIDVSIPRKELPKWLFWIKRMVDHKSLRFVKGEKELPATYEEIIAMNGGPIQVSEDYGLKPLNKDVHPFNVISLEDFPEPELEKAGK